MFKHLAVAALAIMAFAAPALALDTAGFVQKAEEAGEFEIASSDLAKHKAQSPDVKKFAQQMITDHTNAGEKLKAAAAKAGVKPERVNTPSEAHKADMEKLEGTKTGEFDATYVDIQRKAHQEAVSLFREYAKEGDDPDLRRFAQETLPTLEQHFAHVKSITVSGM